MHLHTIAIVWCIVVRMEWLLLSLLSLKRVSLLCCYDHKQCLAQAVVEGDCSGIVCQKLESDFTSFCIQLNLCTCNEMLCITNRNCNMCLVLCPIIVLESLNHRYNVRVHIFVSVIPIETGILLTRALSMCRVSLVQLLF